MPQESAWKCFYSLYWQTEKSNRKSKTLEFLLWSVILSRCSWLSVHVYDGTKKGEIISSWTENKYMYYVLLGNLLYVFPSHFISRSANTGENKHYYLSSNRYFRTISFIGHLYGQTYLWAYRNCASSGLIARAQSGQSMRNSFKMYAEATHFKNKS